MKLSGFTTCSQVFSFQCNGEVANLILAAERYGVLLDKARTRIETICGQCKNSASLGSLYGGNEETCQAA